MKVFVTGGTGFIGSLVVEKLRNRGHQVCGLARSDQAEQKLRAAGATVLRGTLYDLDKLKKGAAAADGVIHLGFLNDFAHYEEAVAMDLAAVKAMGSVLEGTNKPFVNTAGTLSLSGLGRIATEQDHGPAQAPRVASEEAVIALAAKGVRASVVRLAPCVHDVGRYGLVSFLLRFAAKNKVSAYVEEGANVWPAVHRQDAAALFCRALTDAPAGTRLNAVAEEGNSMKKIAQIVGQNLQVPVKCVSAKEAPAYFGFFASSVSLDNPTSSATTQTLLNWKPTQATLFADMNTFYAKQ